MSDDILSKNPKAIAEAQAIRDRKSDAPPVPNYASDYDTIAELRRSFAEHALPQLRGDFDAFLKRQEMPAEIKGALDEVFCVMPIDVFRTCARGAVHAYNARHYAGLANEQNQLAQMNLSKGTLQLNDIGLKPQVADHAFIDLIAGVLRTCKCPDGTHK